MFKVIRKWWNYMTAKLSGSFEARADPKVQLEQAITEAKTQHIRLKEQAASVIANQKQGEMRLNQKLDDLDRLNANARQALKMAADAQSSGGATKAAEYNATAETIATQLIQVEKDVESQKTFLLEAARASDQAKAAVEQNSRLLQQKLSEQSKLLSQLDQAKMQEEMNSAMASLNETVGGDVPTFNEVEQKIQARYAKAKAMSELNDTSVESRMLEVEQATANVEAQGRLEAMRQELGISAPVVATMTPPAELSTQSATPSEAIPDPAPEAQPAPAPHTTDGGGGSTPS
jgi:phage shock protein A